MSTLKTWLLNLNVFQPDPNSGKTESHQDRRVNIIATRIYLPILTYTLILIGIYFRLVLRTGTVTIRNPNAEIFDKFPVYAQCPCSQISLWYDEFTSWQPVFHQICSSDFISNRWTRTIYSRDNMTYFGLRDFRRFGSSQFQALAGLCLSAQDYVQESISSFGRRVFISSQAWRENEFLLNMKSAIDQFLIQAPNTFKAQLELLLRLKANNKLVSGLQTNYMIYHYSGSGSIEPARYMQDNGQFCNCLLDFPCNSQAYLFNATPIRNNPYPSMNGTKITGLASGCLPMTSILASTLECFYDQQCINSILSHFQTTERFSAMIFNNQSRFPINDTVQTIVDELMVEDWKINISYDKYYKKCAPTVCTYSLQERQDLISVFTKLVGLLSGLTLALSLMIPFIVRLVMKNMTEEQAPTVRMSVRLKQLKDKLKQLVLEFNLFKENGSTDQQLRFQRYGTRLFIVLICISIGLLTTIKLIREINFVYTITNPTESEYISLETRHSTTLWCPCKSIAIPYSDFISLQVDYHQLCSSYLVSSTWFAYSSSRIDRAEYILDYRIHARGQFEMLAVLCSQARKMITDSTTILLGTELANLKVMKRDLFTTEVNLLLENWKLTTIGQYVRLIQMIRHTGISNQLMNRLNIFFQTSNHDGRWIRVEPRVYGGCNCALSKTCRSTMGIHTYSTRYDNFTLHFSIPNFFVGCYLLDALLLSTLECFHDAFCMGTLDQYLNSALRQPLRFPALNSTINSPTETIQALVDHMMVTRWSWNISFSSYYSMCAPTLCQIEYQSPETIFNIIVSIIGIFGGLSIGLKMLIFLGLQISRAIINRYSFSMLKQSVRNVMKYKDADTLKRRLHMALVITTLAVLYIFSAFTPRLIVVSIDKPSIFTYFDLFEKYPESVECSCGQISIQHQSFINMTVSFHPICSKDFLERLWLAGSSWPNLYRRNFSKFYTYSAAGQYQALSSLCQISQETVHNSASQLLNSHTISSKLLPKALLAERIHSIINEYRRSVRYLLLNVFELIRKTTVSNKYMTTFASTWTFPIVSGYSYGEVVHTIPVKYGTCDCGLTSDCSSNLFDFVVGCYILETLLKSTLQCMYNQYCFDITGTYPALNTTLNPSRFPINITFESLFQELMIEDLSYSSSFEKYYSQCSPTSCTYSYTEKINVVEGIAVLISLYGGLMIICRWISLLIFKLLPCKTMKVTPINFATNT